ncbi:DUF1491 family protein [Nitratireductor luteus]|uniref:DUF1491 family protein n=1 Tax=Nitratireductor luteus TaxID=2976980 RepID=UPI0022401C48|nr:DUF1491 family protein [Nitratireductor luteus]
MRITSDLWVSALVRRVFADGGFAAIRRRGAREAGAIMVLFRKPFGEVDLFIPAPQTSYDDTRPHDRQFMAAKTALQDADIDQIIERELRFDSDIWVVELETARAAENYIAVVEP